MQRKLLVGYVLLGISVAAVSCVVTTEKPADSVPPPAPPPPPPAPTPTVTAEPAPTATTPEPAATATTTATTPAPSASVPPGPPKRSELKAAKKAPPLDGGTTTSDGGN